MFVPVLLLCAGTIGGAAVPPTEAAACPELASQAEAAMKTKDWAKASALWERVIELNPVVASYWDRLGRARYEAKDFRKAIPAYEKALALRARFPWALAYDAACCHALLGEKDRAMALFEKAFALGFRPLHLARTDDDLKSLRDEPRFQELVALVDTQKMSRVEGWRYDLRLLVRELKRIHYVLSKQTVPADQEAFVQKLQDDIPKLKDHQIEVALMKLAAMAGDGHTSGTFPFQLSRRYKAIPLRFYQFEEGVFVISAAPGHKDLVGGKVVRFGEKSVEQVENALDSLISHDNTAWPKYVRPALMRYPQILCGLGLVPEKDKVALTVQKAGMEEYSATVVTDSGDPAEDWPDARAAAAGPDPLCLKNPEAGYWFEYLPKAKTIYVQYRRVVDDQGESIEQFYGRLFRFVAGNDVNRLVIDMRNNDGGNMFLNRPLIEGLIRSDKINRRGHLFVIIGRKTFSAAQCVATQIERYTEAIFVGEPSGSCPNFVGETVRLDLPYSKMRFSISDLYWQNSAATDYRTWIGPEIYTPPTFEAYRAKRDSAMEAILAYPGER
jgi:hypothetical protein